MGTLCLRFHSHDRTVVYKRRRQGEKCRLINELAVAKGMTNQLGNLVESIKSKVRSLKKAKKPYIKMDKSASVKVEIRSRKARKLIEKTLKAADTPSKRTLS
ncbi:hypothetical protein E2542_SST07524 [Spatholobus suberectus]|nr:hypothetical protein E2542_SST07524 [Spatholobus suberectus]